MPPPLLLVSVRSPDEARAAIAGGCDLLDIKEPGRGSLGAADPEVVSAICGAVESAVPVSVALGELSDWPADRPPFALPAAITYAKLGLSGCKNDAAWATRWRALRERFDDDAGRALDWIAVLYADGAAEPPDAALLIDLAATTGCRGLLVDTYLKDGRTVFDHVPIGTLSAWSTATRAAGLLFAVAGSIRLEDIPCALAVNPDIIAVRSAACVTASRTSPISTPAVHRLKSTLLATVSTAANA